MSKKEIRWIQRFTNFNRSLDQLSKFVEKGDLSELEKPGLIKLFETTYELSWLTIKDFYEEQGESGIQGSKDVIKMATERGLLQNGRAWMQMIESRKLTVHTYNIETADEVEEAVIQIYHELFKQLQKKLEEQRSGAQTKFKFE